jgi:uncharacterized RDD family membrane protein YckC
MKYAGFWFRFLAWLIDNILLTVVGFVGGGVIGFILGFILGMAQVPLNAIQVICGLAGGIFGLIITWLYFAICESSAWQATLGKKLLGLKVTDEAGSRINFARASGRYWAKFLSSLILLIGFIMVAFTEKKQGLHDKLAETLVWKAGA